MKMRILCAVWLSGGALVCQGRSDLSRAGLSTFEAHDKAMRSVCNRTLSRPIRHYSAVFGRQTE